MGSRQQGFTLIELVTVIVILGIVSVGLTGFIRNSMQTFVDVRERDALISQSRFVMERMNRELRAAVPGSTVVAGNTSAHCMAFVPITWSSFYTDLPVLPSTNTEVSVVEMADIDNNKFIPQGGDFGIVYPTDNAAVYDSSQNRSKEIEGCTDDDCDAVSGIMKLDVSGAFAESSPASRLYIVRNVIRYCATAGNIYRSVFGYQGFNINNLLSNPSAGALMGQNLINQLSSDPTVQNANSDDPFRVYDATLSRNGFIHLFLRFARDSEIITFSNEVHVANVP